MPGIANRPSTLPARRDQLQSQLRDARQESRGDRQQSRQDFRTERREDWQDFADNHYGHHNDWHHGYWHGNFGDWWDHMWDDHTALMTLGVTRWGINRIGSWFGYSSYANPYYDSGSGGGGGYADYSEPVTMDATQAAAVYATDSSATASTLPPGVSQEAVDKFNQARGAFYNGQYADALKLTDEALTKMPKDAVMHEFRALCLFTLKRYREAAAAMNAVLAVGPGWDWTTLSGLYANPADYTTQLRALEDYVGANPKSPDGHFLVAYHYITIGDNKNAISELKKVLALQPNDTVATDMLRMLSAAEQPASTPPTSPPAPTVAADAVVGTWSAQGPKNAKYEMSLSADGAFRWTYTRGSSKQEVKGVYAVDGSNIALQPDAGGTMLLDVKLPAPDRMHADIVGAVKGDPGLDFTRTAK